MSELKEMIGEVVEKIFKDKIEKETVDLLEENKWAENIWQVLLDNELHNVAVAEEHGGAGGDVEDLFALYELVGKYAAPVPFVEHTLANLLLQVVGETPVEELVTYSVVKPLSLVGEAISGSLPHVPWAQYAQKLVTLAKENDNLALVVVSIEKGEAKHSTNLAAEPRSALRFEQVTAERVITLTAAQAESITQLVTAASVSKMNGALETAFQLSVQFSKEREQFGRPIHRFQLVQQHLAIMAGEQTLMTVATSNVEALLAEGAAKQEVGYARLRMDDASKAVATAAHQVHAAIGVTHEHRLHQFTRRLWAWRDEDYTGRYWKKALAKQTASSSLNLWESLTEQDETHAHV